MSASPPRDRLTAGMAPYRSPTPSPSTPPSGTLPLSKARPTATSSRSVAIGHYRRRDPRPPRRRRATDGGWVPVTGAADTHARPRERGHRRVLLIARQTACSGPEHPRQSDHPLGGHEHGSTDHSPQLETRPGARLSRAQRPTMQAPAAHGTATSWPQEQPSLPEPRSRAEQPHKRSA